MATVDHAGDRFLHRGFGRSANALRNAGDLNTDQGSQLTSMAFTAVLATREGCNQHGPPRRLAGQRVRRAPVALREMRGGLPAACG